MNKARNKVEDQYKQQLKKYDEQIEKAKAKKRAIQRKEREEKRKQRTRRLIEIGALAEIAELTEYDTGLLLGILLQGKQIIEDEPTYKNLKKLGDSTLKYRERQREKMRQKRANRV